MLPSSSTFIYLIFTFIFVASMSYYTRKVVIYKVDERGLSILAKASVITFASVLLLFCLFMLYISFGDIFDLPFMNDKIPLYLIRNIVSLAMSLVGVVNVLAIKYFEKHM